MTRRSIASALVVLTALGGGAAAQVSVPPTIEPTASQEEALRQGTEAYRIKDYTGAVAAYDAALAIGPLNIAWLNKGRALQRMGDCNGAADAYVRVLDAPAVTEPSPDTVRGALTRYQQQLAEQCPGTLVVTCDPLGAKLQFVDSPDHPAADLPRIGCGTLVELQPGPYTIIARAHQQTERHRITIIGVQTQTLAIQITPLSEIEQGIDTWTIAGWTGVALSAVSLGAGIFGSLQVDKLNDEMRRLAAEGVVERNDIEDVIDEVRIYEAVQWTSYALAAASLAAGIWMLDRGRDSPTLTPAASKSSAGALLTIPF